MSGDTGTGVRDPRRASFLMLAALDTPTGGYDFNFRMVECLRERGVEVDVIHYRTVPRFFSRNRLAGSVYALLRVLRFRPGLLIVSKSYPYAVMLRLLRFLLRARFVYLVHHPDWIDPRPGAKSLVYRIMAGWAMGLADAVWCNSRSTLRELEKLGAGPARTVVINPGFHRGSPGERMEPGSGTPLLLCVGSLVPRKSQDVLVRACALLRDRGVDFELTLAGDTGSDPAFAESVRSSVEESGLTDRIGLTGHLDPERLARAYREADIMVHSPRWEAFGIAVAEGMSWGLPVVAFDVGGVGELVADGSSGLLVEPGDVAGLADAIQKLIMDPSLRREMGRRSLERSRGMNDWESCCEEFGRFAFDVAGWERPGPAEGKEEA